MMRVPGEAPCRECARSRLRRPELLRPAIAREMVGFNGSPQSLGVSELRSNDVFSNLLSAMLCIGGLSTKLQEFADCMLATWLCLHSQVVGSERGLCPEVPGTNSCACSDWLLFRWPFQLVCTYMRIAPEFYSCFFFTFSIQT